MYWLWVQGRRRTVVFLLFLFAYWRPVAGKSLADMRFIITLWGCLALMNVRQHTLEIQSITKRGMYAYNPKSRLLDCKRRLFASQLAAFCKAEYGLS